MGFGDSFITITINVLSGKYYFMVMRHLIWKRQCTDFNWPITITLNVYKNSYYLCQPVLFH